MGAAKSPKRKPKPRKPPSNPVRARGRHHSAAKDALVTQIIGMMVKNEWRGAASHLELQKSTGLCRDSINQSASAASRYIRLCRGDVRESILRSIDHATDLALKADMVVYDQDRGEFKRAKKPDLSALRSFLQLQTDVHGLTGKVSERAQRADAAGDQIQVPIDELTDLLGSLGYDVTKREQDDGESSDGDEDSGSGEPDSGAHE